MIICDYEWVQLAEDTLYFMTEYSLDFDKAYECAITQFLACFEE